MYRVGTYTRVPRAPVHLLKTLKIRSCHIYEICLALRVTHLLMLTISHWRVLQLLVYKLLSIYVHWNPDTMRPNTLYPIQCCFFLDPKCFSKNFQLVSRHKKFIYFLPYHRILTKILSLVEKKTDMGSVFIYKYGRILTKIFSLDEKTDETSVRETNLSSCLPKIHAFPD